MIEYKPPFSITNEIVLYVSSISEKIGTIGRTYVVKPDDRFYYKDASVICFENFGQINPFYVKFIMESPFMIKQIVDKSAGTTVATITMTKANGYFIPLPPLQEQHRIVERIEEILPLIKEL